MFFLNNIQMQQFILINHSQFQNCNTIIIGKLKSNGLAYCMRVSFFTEGSILHYLYNAKPVTR